MKLTVQDLNSHYGPAHILFDIGFEDGIRPALAQPEWPVPDGSRAG